MGVTSLVPISQDALGAGPRQDRPEDCDKLPDHGAGWAGKEGQAGLGINPQIASTEFTLPAAPHPDQ